MKGCHVAKWLTSLLPVNTAYVSWTLRIKADSRGRKWTEMLMHLKVVLMRVCDFCWATKNVCEQFFRGGGEAQLVLNVLDKWRGRSKRPWSVSKDLRQLLLAGAEWGEEAEKRRPGEIGSTIIFCWTLWGLIICPPLSLSPLHTHTQDPVSLCSSRVLLMLTYCSCWLCTYPVLVPSLKLRQIADTANKHTHT